MHYNSPLRPGRSKIELDRSVRDCVHKHAAASGVLWGMPPPPPNNFYIWCSEIASEAIFGPFFSLICSSWQASTMPWLVCYATMWLHVVLASFPDTGSTKFAQLLSKKKLVWPWRAGSAGSAPAAPMHAHIQTSALDTSIHRVVTVV